MEIKPTLITWVSEHWYKIVNLVVDDLGVPTEETHYIPSVTTKLSVKDKPFLARWRGDLGNREADMRLYDAQQKGKRIHWAVETMLKGGTVIYDPWQSPIYTPDQILHLQSFGSVVIIRTQEEMLDVWKVKQQIAILKPKVMDVELTVYDLENKDAGTIDHIYEIQEGVYPINGRTPVHLDAGIYVGDLKTGNVVSEDVWMQLAPYAFMYQKATGNEIAGALVTHTGAKTKTGIPGLATLVRPRQNLIEKDYPDYRRASDLWLRDHKDDKPETYEVPSLLKI